jgi:hypothetical protein
VRTTLAASMAAAVPCFATLLCLDGSHWIEPGRMGFGESSDTRDSRAAYNAKVNELLDGLGADTWITVVDCHI